MLDVARVADAAQQPLGGRGRLALREAGDVGQRLRARQVGFVVAHVVGEADGRRVREAADEVAAPDLGRVDAHLLRRRLDQPLDHVGGFGPARAAVGVDRSGVGEHAGDLAVDLGRSVLAGQQGGVQRHATHKRLGAINRIDQPAIAGTARLLTEFLTQQAMIRPIAGDQFAQLLLRLAVGDGDGGVVGFAFGGQAGLEVAEGDASGLPGGVEGKFEQGLGGRCCHDVTPRP